MSAFNLANSALNPYNSLMQASNPRKKSLVLQISLSYLFLFAISALLFTYVIATSQIELISENVRYKANELGESLSQSLNNRLSFEAENKISHYQQIMNKSSLSFFIIQNDSILFRDSKIQSLPSNLKTNIVKSLSLKEYSGSPSYLDFKSKQRILEIYIPIIDQKNMVVVAIKPLETIDSRFNNLYKSISSSVLLLSFLFAFFGYLLHKRLIKPLAIISKATENVSQGNFNVKVEIISFDEFGDLASRFNLMTQTIGNHVQSLHDQMLKIEESKQQIEEMSRIDPLTTLFNRRYLFEQLNYFIDHSNRYQNELGLMILDVDFFKKINDGYGHKTGDEVLSILGKTLKETCRTVDIIGRYGGEEIVIVCPKTNLANTSLLAERIRIKISQIQFPLDNGTFFNATLSIGVTENLTQCGKIGKALSASELIDSADSCLYFAKENGRNQVVSIQVS